MSHYNIGQKLCPLNIFCSFWEFFFRRFGGKLGSFRWEGWYVLDIFFNYVLGDLEECRDYFTWIFII